MWELCLELDKGEAGSWYQKNLALWTGAPRESGRDGVVRLEAHRAEVSVRRANCCFSLMNL